MNGIRKHACIDCHFLLRESDQLKFGLTPAERDAILKDDYSWLNQGAGLACWFGVWDEGYQREESARREMIVETDRQGFCFFFEHRPGMLFPAAEVLQRREADNREAASDRRYIIVGLWIAALALVFNFVVEFINFLSTSQ